MIIETRLTKLFNGAIGVAIYPFILIHPDYADDTEILNHEAIHLEQQKELWFIGFYVLYVYYFLKEYYDVRDWNKAYWLIPFEAEAYDFDANLAYLDGREPFKWKEYIL